jgi:ubiquinone/menaquinone biosynthesis C-methylase UbiE
MSKHQQFWDNEYKTSEHLSLSTEPAEDLEKFTRWLDRNHEVITLSDGETVLDLGSGNGRNIIYLAKNFPIKGVGYDISGTATKQATERARSEHIDVEFITRSIAGKIDLADESCTLVLDMMTSHYLNQSERLLLRDEVFRVLKPGGFYFLKSFLLEGDLHVKRLFNNFPGKEKNSYIHPKIGVEEHVLSLSEIEECYESVFWLKRLYKSHKHMTQGRAFRRRTVALYFQKPFQN